MDNQPTDIELIEGLIEQHKEMMEKGFSPVLCKQGDSVLKLLKGGIEIIDDTHVMMLESECLSDICDGLNDRLFQLRDCLSRLSTLAGLPPLSHFKYLEPRNPTPVLKIVK